MAIAIKKSSTNSVKQTVTSSLPEEVQAQISNNIKLDTTDYSKEPEPFKESVTTNNELKQTITQEETKGKRSDDVVQLKFSKGKRSEAKAFFASCDVKMNAGFEMAYEFLKEELQAGRVKLSKSGIQRIKAEN